jgi:hypothetical protein
VKVPLVPVTVTVNVPLGPVEFEEIFNEELFPLVTGLTVKLADVRFGNPDTLKVIELVPPCALVTTLTDPFPPRLKDKLAG